MTSLSVCCLPLKNYIYNNKIINKQELKSKEATFHAACVQLVSLNFALHEAKSGTHIITEPVRMRSLRKQLNAPTLERLRDVYYSSVKQGAEVLGCIKTHPNINLPHKATENVDERKHQMKAEYITETSGRDSGNCSAVTSVWSPTPSSRQKTAVSALQSHGSTGLLFPWSFSGPIPPPRGNYPKAIVSIVQKYTVNKEMMFCAKSILPI